MRVAMAGGSRSRVGAGLGFAATADGGSSWSTIIGDLSKQWTNIAGSILAPPAYRDANGVEIRNNTLPSLLTSGQTQTGVPVGTGNNNSLVGGAQQGVQQVTGVSTQTMFGVGAALLLVMVMMQSGGRR